ncbi:adenylate kinase [Thioclava sp. L04-15]|uniref:AAA family ATPase n=1 Tax=Thioclava sp. L04-15 TaxID=1915318 RepID=UPI000997F9EF|nr:AAA family ATPase [Thioclava sp. L04-15]OOY28415.1 adenylate kinase [Thioclava sp. L04-15]TNE94557.1 MAG: adenylate kinase [Paracoccaceae bacterium]
MAARVHITGAAGSGTSSLGRGIAERLDVPHLDTDAFFWAPSDPPYTVKRPPEERLQLMEEAKAPGGWVISGSLDGWGEPVIEGADLIVFLSAPTPIRLARIRKREALKFGERIRAGGDLFHNHAAFLKWASNYDDPYFSGRSLSRHREWLAGRSEPVLNLSGARPVEDLVSTVLATLSTRG